MHVLFLYTSSFLSHISNVRIQQSYFNCIYGRRTTEPISLTVCKVLHVKYCNMRRDECENRNSTNSLSQTAGTIDLFYSFMSVVPVKWKLARVIYKLWYQKNLPYLTLITLNLSVSTQTTSAVWLLQISGKVCMNESVKSPTIRCVHRPAFACPQTLGSIIGLSLTICCNSVESGATTSAQIHLLHVFSLRGQITHISKPLNIATRGESKKRIGLFQRWMCLAAFGHTTQNQRKGTSASFDEAFQPSLGDWIAKG